jgi:hypothetical protein
MTHAYSSRKNVTISLKKAKFKEKHRPATKEKFIRLVGPIPDQIMGWKILEEDLRKSLHAFKIISKISADVPQKDRRIIASIFYESAISSYGRAFTGNNKKAKIHDDDIRRISSDAFKNHLRLMDIRHKIVAHTDLESSYLRAKPGCYVKIFDGDTDVSFIADPQIKGGKPTNEADIAVFINLIEEIIKKIVGPSMKKTFYILENAVQHQRNEIKDSFKKGDLEFNISIKKAPS